MTARPATTPDWPDVEVERALWGWQSIRHPRPEVHEHHLVPLLDTGPHFMPEHGGEGCPCGAIEDCPGSVVHNAWDGREQYEQGLRKRH